MKLASFLCACVLLAPVAAAVPGLSLAQVAEAPRAKVKAGYRVPRLADGRPDLQGIWTNATTTRLERPASFGDRAVMSAEELAATEGDTAQRNARQNARTTQAQFENWQTTALQPDTSDECRSGSRGTACGYNAGWTDPGDLVMRVNGEPRTSFITFPANGRLPPRVTNAERVRIETGEGGPASSGASQNDNPEGRSLAERCVLMGAMGGPVMGPGLYNNTFRFVQTKDHLAIWVEMIHDVRIVRIGGAPRTDGVRSYLGDSVGRWDDDTLVVETTNYHPGQNLRGGSPNMKVTERFTRVAGDRLHYAFKVEDPSVWTQAWGGEYEFGATNGIYEYACHESNYGLENILAGARYEEQEAGGRQAARP